MIRTFAWALAAGVGLFGALACGSDDGDAGGPAQDWYKRYAHALCTGVAPCCQAAGQAHDVASCEQLYNYVGGLGVKQAVDRGARFDKAAGEQCLTELSTWFDGCSTSTGEPEICNKVISGKGGPGATCSFDFDCAQPAVGSEHCTYSTQSGDEGQCILHLPPEDGKPCTSADGDTTEYDCNFVDDFYCDYSNNLCQAKVALGGDCSGSQSCVDSTYCDSIGTCIERIAVGGDCSLLPSACAKSTYCDGSTCQALKAPGEPCSGGDCKDFCDSTTKTCSAVGTGGYFCVTSS